MYSKTIQKIHTEFDTACDNALMEANKIVGGNEFLIDKSIMLTMVGFVNSVEVKKASVIKMSKDTANLITYYRQKYPFNKFISEDQVLAILKKYNLVCGPIDRYKGFVPNDKLKQISAFSIKPEDKESRMVKLNYSMYMTDRRGIGRLRKKYPKDIVPIEVVSNSQTIRGFGGGSGWISISGYDEINRDTFFICAPKRDMELSGLSKFGALMASVTHVSIPDPVVLRPVKGGYLVVAAWGDEASDKDLVNQIDN